MGDDVILVGYDGSSDSEDALAWAAREALARGSALTICLAHGVRYPALQNESAAPLEEGQSSDEQTFAAGLRHARDLMRDGEVRPLFVAGPPAAVLCLQCSDVGMLVVGSRGSGGLPGLPVGSVSLQVAAHAPGRVVVVRGCWHDVPGHSPGPVVVGSEGSPASEAAVGFAFEEAVLRGTWLLAVCALADAPGALGGGRRISNDFEQLISRREKGYPDVRVRRQVSEGSARHALLEAAAGAQMLIVGARGRGGLPGMSLGSIGHAMVAYAPCPVGVAHADATR